jgi:hypothetical protein
MGKTEDALAQERQYFLDLFIKKCCELTYLADSNEMQTFLRPGPKDEVAKELDLIPKRKTEEQLEMLRQCVPLSDMGQ